MPAPNLSGATGAVGPGGGGGGGSRTCASGFLGNAKGIHPTRDLLLKKNSLAFFPKAPVVLSSHRIDCFSFFRKKKSY